MQVYHDMNISNSYELSSSHQQLNAVSGLNMITSDLTISGSKISSQTASGLKIDQPEKGYRFSVDPILLVSEIIPSKQEQILDIGTGCGIMPLLLAIKYPHVKITAVEIQKELFNIAQKNTETNRLSKSIKLINSDIKQFGNSDTYGKFDRVISNPPYKKKGSGRLNADMQKAIARHEIALTLDELILCSARFLKPAGILNLVYTAARLPELIFVMNSNAIKPAIIKYVNTGEQRSPKLVLVTGIKEESYQIS